MIRIRIARTTAVVITLGSISFGSTGMAATHVGAAAAILTASSNDVGWQ